MYQTCQQANPAFPILTCSQPHLHRTCMNMYWNIGTCTVERPQPIRASTRVASIQELFVYASQVPTFIPNTHQGVPLLPWDHPIDLAIEHRRQTDNLPTTYCAAWKIKGDVPKGSDLDLMNHAFIARHYNCPNMKSEKSASFFSQRQKGIRGHCP